MAYERNEEISNFYMNRIAIDEENQLEVSKIDLVRIIFQGKRYRLSDESLKKITNAFISYQAKKSEVTVSKTYLIKIVSDNLSDSVSV